MLEGKIFESAVFFVDGGDIQSYARGTSWFDLLYTSGVGVLVDVDETTGHLNFNGTTSRADFDKNTDQDDIFAGGGTLSFWARPESDGGTDEGHVVDTTGAAITAGYFSAFNQEASGRVAFRFVRNFDTTAGIWEAQVGEIPLDEWSHVAVLYDDSSTANDPTILINGVECPVTEVQAPVGTAVSDATSDLIVGNRDDAARGFDGDIEIVLLHNSELSLDEARQLFRASYDRFFVLSRDTYGFSVGGFAISTGVDVFFGFSGVGSIGTMDSLVTLGLGVNKLTLRRGHVSGFVIRVSAAITVDVFVVVNGVRTVIAASVALVADVTTVVPITTDVCFSPGDELRAGVVPASGLSVDIEAELELEYF